MATLNYRNNLSGRLIAASTMRGSTVFDAALDELGRIEDFIIEEPGGQIVFAILRTGGVPGLTHHYPLRWEKLRFNVEVHGYIVDVDRDVREGTLSHSDRGTASWDDEV